MRLNAIKRRSDKVELKSEPRRAPRSSYLRVSADAWGPNIIFHLQRAYAAQNTVSQIELIWRNTIES